MKTNLLTLPAGKAAGVLMIALLQFISFNISAQDPLWARQSQGAGFQEFRNLTTDAAGHVYAIGSFEGAAVLGTSTLNSAGIYDVFFAKYAPDGTLLWARSVGGTGVESGYDIGTDATGNVYITGNFNGSADFDPGPGQQVLTSAGSFDIFLAKYTPDGALLWARNMGGTQFEEGRGLAVNAAGQCAVAGIFTGETDLDPDTAVAAFQSFGENDVFLALYDADGRLTGAGQMGGAGFERVLAMTMDADGDLYIAGHFQGSADFDPSDDNALLDSNGDSDLFFARYGAGGHLKWARSAGSFLYEEVRDIAVDRWGHVFVTGRYGATFDMDPGPEVHLLEHTAINDAFLAKYDADGQLLWAANISGENNEMGDAVAVDSAGRVYASGHFINSIDADPGPDAFTLSGVGDFDVFVAQYDADGALLQAFSAGGAQMEESSCIAIDAQQNILLAGFFKGSADFDPEAATLTLNSAGKEDGFLVKYAGATTATRVPVPLPDVRLYPVPATGVLHVAVDESATEILEMIVGTVAGKTLYTLQNPGPQPVLDVSMLPSGMYFLLLRTGAGDRCLKFEVMR